MTVWQQMVGQSTAVAQLRAAAEEARRILAGEGGTLAHSWLFTGPPGSGRSVAARCLAAALQCTGVVPGCGECSGCRSVMARSNPDVHEFSTDAQMYDIKEVREEWIPSSHAGPSLGKWRVLLIEDADRLRPDSQNTLLKSLEEPPARTLWFLCAPRAGDLLITVRSRCRHLNLVTPPAEAVAALLSEEMGASSEAANTAAQISQSHIGYAKALIRDPGLRQNQIALFMTALRVNSVGEAVLAATRLVNAAKKTGEERFDREHDREVKELLADFGVQEGERLPRGLQSQIKQLTDQQKRRKKRALADELDRIFVDLLGFFRDVQIFQAGSPVQLINPDLEEEIAAWAKRVSDRDLPPRIDAIQLARERLNTNMAALLNVESLLIGLHRPELAS